MSFKDMVVKTLKVYTSKKKSTPTYYQYIIHTIYKTAALKLFFIQASSVVSPPKSIQKYKENTSVFSFL